MTHTLKIYGALFDTDNPKHVGIAEVSAQLDAIPVDANNTLEVRISSPGGSVMTGQAILALLNARPEYKIAYIDGMAASYATVLAFAMDKVIMSNPGRIMIHESRGGGMTTVDEKEKEIAFQSAVNAEMVQAYMKKSGKDEKEIKALMKAETWFTAQEALDNGFVDELFSSTMKIAAYADDYAVILSHYNNVPNELKEKNMDKIIAAVGLGADVSEDVVIAKINDFRSTIANKTELISSLTAKVEQTEGKVTALQSEKNSLTAELATFKTADVIAKVQAETATILGAECLDKINRRVERYLAESDESVKADAYDDLKAFCIANGVKANDDANTGNGRPNSDTVAQLEKEADELSKKEGIPFATAYVKVLEAKQNGK